MSQQSQIFGHELFNSSSTLGKRKHLEKTTTLQQSLLTFCYLKKRSPYCIGKYYLLFLLLKKIASELLNEIIWKMTEGFYYENVTKFEFVIQ